MTGETGGELRRWRTFGERTVYDDPSLWVGQVDVELPGGERVWRPVVRMHRAVSVMLLDDQDQVLLLWRYRFVKDRIGGELPGGLVDRDEDPADAAVRHGHVVVVRRDMFLQARLPKIGLWLGLA